jgi:hypothetical protein
MNDPSLSVFTKETPMDNAKVTLGPRLQALLHTPSVRVVVEARPGNGDSDFNKISLKGLQSLHEDSLLVLSACTALASLEIQVEYAHCSFFG